MKTIETKTSILELKNKKLEIAREVYQKELSKLRPKYKDIDERINTDFSLTARQFANLLKKRQDIQECIEALEYGVVIITECIKQNQYLIKNSI